MPQVAIVLDLLLDGHGRQGDMRVDILIALVAFVLLILALPSQPSVRRRNGVLRFVGLGTRRVTPQGITARWVTVGSFGRLGLTSRRVVTPYCPFAARFLPLGVWTRRRSQRGVTARRVRVVLMARMASLWSGAARLSLLTCALPGLRWLSGGLPDGFWILGVVGSVDAVSEAPALVALHVQLPVVRELP